MTNQIQTPFLRYLLLYYGNLAVQLRPVRLNQPLSCLNFLWNFFLMATSFAFALSQKGRYEKDLLDPIQETETEYKIQVSQKPLFNMFTKFTFKYAFPTAYTFCFYHFFAINLFKPSNNLDLLTLFDSFRVELFDNKSKAKKLVFYLILITHLNFLTVVPSYWWEDAFATNWLNLFEVLNLLRAYFTFYVLKFCLLVIIGVIMYFRFALLNSLKQAKLNFEKDKSFEKLESNLRTLAYTSLQIRQLLSFPLMLITFIYTFDVIIEIASLLLNNNRLDFFYQMAISSNLLIIVYYGEAINWELKKLDELLKIQKIKNETKQKKNSLLFFKKSNHGFNTETEIHQTLKGREMIAVYKVYFQLKLFNFFTGDLSFTHNTALFILNYAVLVTQTNA